MTKVLVIGACPDSFGYDEVFVSMEEANKFFHNDSAEWVYAVYHTSNKGKPCISIIEVELEMDYIKGTFVRNVTLRNCKDVGDV